MEYILEIKNVCQLETRRVFTIMTIVAICVLLLQTFTFPNRRDNTIPVDEERRLHVKLPLPPKPTLTDDDHFLDESESYSSPPVLNVARVGEVSSLGKKPDNGIEGEKQDPKNDVSLDNNHGVYDISESDEDDIEDDASFLEEASDTDKNSSEIFDVGSSETNVTKEEQAFLLRDGFDVLNTTMATGNATVKKLKACDMPPQCVMTVSEMNSLLLQRKNSANFTKQRRVSPRDKELLSARSQIENARIVRSDRELYAPLFRNLSVFKRSYELMERTLRVYVYKEGERPIFHKPLLKGVYASEGWFMKLMEESNKFRVKDPRRAHLFYIPFSSRLLEFTLYVPNSHNRLNLREYLGNYTNTIAAKYPFWNRTGGADHFFVACHDWAPYETRYRMDSCVKCMCNADVLQGFVISKDVSLPETYVRSARNPVRDIGGEPPSNRSILAFFAGSMHGYLRPILLSHWENKDPDMKILGRMPFGVASKMDYIRYMKTSKYCVCAKGYNVNSPRVVEAIFYECVPVIISDNFVPPFFEVLNWEAFSVIVAEKDIPNLKNILDSIPYEKYVALQRAVKKAQQHFVWHSKPVKYDLFHMTLHSIWFNRVFRT